MEKLKYPLATGLLSLLVLFILQNMAVVELNFLFWSFHSRRFFVIAFALFVGFVIGWVLCSRRKNRQDRDALQAEDK